MRYFNFSYKYYGSGKEGFGQLHVRHQGESFPNKNFLYEEIYKMLKEKYGEYSQFKAVILGWNEMNESDYNDFTKEP